MRASILTALPIVALCHAGPTPQRQTDRLWGRISSLLQPLLGDSTVDVAGLSAPVTTEILQDYLEPVNVSYTSLLTTTMAC